MRSARLFPLLLLLPALQLAASGSVMPTLARAAPTITNITPNYGPAAGGPTITVEGTGFSTTPCQTRFVSFTPLRDVLTDVSCTSDTRCIGTLVSASISAATLTNTAIMTAINGEEGPPGRTSSGTAGRFSSASLPAADRRSTAQWSRSPAAASALPRGDGGAGLWGERRTVRNTTNGRPTVPSSTFTSGGSIVVDLFTVGP